MRILIVQLTAIYFFLTGIGCIIGYNYFDLMFCYISVIISSVIYFGSALTFYLIGKQVKKQSEFGIQILISTIFKLFLYALTIVMLYLSNKDYIIKTVTLFGIYYAVFTLYEKQKLMGFIKSERK